MENAPDLSLVTACFDEEAALPRLFGELERLAGLARERDLSLETILVDDGSRDGSRPLLEAWCRGRPERRLLAHERNRGFGAAMRTGFAAARGRVLVCYDADATYPVEDVLALLDALPGHDAAGASPFAGGGEAGAGPLRSAASRGAALLYRLALRDRAAGLTAFTCAFRAYRAGARRSAPWRADDFLAAAEVLALLLLDGRRVREVPSRLSARRHGRSKMRLLATGLHHLGMLAAIALRSGRFRARTRPARPPPGLPPPPAAAGLSRWNEALNREWPMRRIEGHANPLVRALEERRRREVLRLAAPRPGQVVLDVGAEEGAYASRIRERGARPLALDIDHAALVRGRRAHGAASVAGDAHALPLRDRSVSRVILAEVLEHCPDPASALSEALRVVSASGRVALSVPDDLGILGLKRLVRSAGLSRLLAGLPAGRAPGHLHLFGREALRRLLSSAGRLLSLTRDPKALAFLAVLVPRPEEG